MVNFYDYKDLSFTSLERPETEKVLERFRNQWYQTPDCHWTRNAVSDSKKVLKQSAGELLKAILDGAPGERFVSQNSFYISVSRTFSRPQLIPSLEPALRILLNECGLYIIPSAIDTSQPTYLCTVHGEENFTRAMQTVEQIIKTADAQRAANAAASDLYASDDDSDDEK